jgi:hypothetical protein
MSLRAAALAALLAACSESRAPTHFHLATVAALPERSLVFVAQPGFGTVDVLRGERLVARLGDPARRHVLRLAVDARRARLWVADFKLIQAYAIDTLAELKRYSLAADVYHERFSDLALDRSGNVFALARGGARVYRIDALTLELEPWLELADRASDPALLLANRMLPGVDERYLFVASAARGELLRIDLRSKAVTPVALNGSADLTCGVLFWDAQPATIRALDCVGAWDARIALAADGLSGTVRLQGTPRAPGLHVRFRP